MRQIIKDLWNGNLAPCEICGSDNSEAKHLISLMERNREKLSAGLTEAQKSVFQRYIDCSEEYLLCMLELAFCDGFSMGSRLTTEALL